MKKALISAIILNLIIFSISCQTSKQTQNNQSVTSNKSESELVDYAVSVAEMKGHLRSSLQGIKEEDFTLAQLHVEHPVEEGLVANIEETLRQQNEGMADELNSTFDSLGQEAADGDSAKLQTASKLLDKALINVVPAKWLEDTSFSSKVIAKLFKRIKEIYTADISDNGEFMGAEADYQDTYGIFHETKGLYKEIELQLDPAIANEVNGPLMQLDKAFTQVNLASAPMPPKKVAKLIDEIIKELESA